MTEHKNTNLKKIMYSTTLTHHTVYTSIKKNILAMSEDLAMIRI